MEGAAHRQLRPDHDAPMVGQRQRAALRDPEGRIVPVRGGTARSTPRTSSWFREKSCEVDGFSGSMTCAWTAATPGTVRRASMV